MAVTWCKFGIHNWGKWKLLQEQWTTYPMGINNPEYKFDYIKEFQSKECASCGKIVRQYLK